MLYNLLLVILLQKRGIVDYGAVSYDGGNLDRYQCLNCGFVLENEEFN